NHLIGRRSYINYPRPLQVAYFKKLRALLLKKRTIFRKIQLRVKFGEHKKVAFRLRVSIHQGFKPVCLDLAIHWVEGMDKGAKNVMERQRTYGFRVPRQVWWQRG